MFTQIYVELNFIMINEIQVEVCCHIEYEIKNIAKLLG